MSFKKYSDMELLMLASIATMNEEMASEIDLTFTTLIKLLAVPTRHRQTPFGVQIDRTGSAKHSCFPFEGSAFKQKNPLFSTLHHFGTL